MLGHRYWLCLTASNQTPRHHEVREISRRQGKVLRTMHHATRTPKLKHMYVLRNWGPHFTAINHTPRYQEVWGVSRQKILRTQHYATRTPELKHRYVLGNWRSFFTASDHTPRYQEVWEISRHQVKYSEQGIMPHIHSCNNNPSLCLDTGIMRYRAYMVRKQTPRYYHGDRGVSGSQGKV